jgi:hypothetical protein
MKFIKILVLLITVLALACFVEIKFNLLPEKYRQSLDTVVGQILGVNSENVQQFVDSSDLGLATLKERSAQLSEKTLEAVDHTVGKAVEPSSEQKPLHDRAFEYGRYLYCQEVVETYKEQN